MSDTQKKRKASSSPAPASESSSQYSSANSSSQYSSANSSSRSRSKPQSYSPIESPIPTPKASPIPTPKASPIPTPNSIHTRSNENISTQTQKQLAKQLKNLSISATNKKITNTNTNTTLDKLYKKNIQVDIKSKDIDTFSRAHFSYINQIFGDETIRNIIQEIYINNKKILVCVPGTGRFCGTNHHIVRIKKTKEIIDSIVQGYQNLNDNDNDNLCQSYSLMNYLGIKNDK